MIIPIFLSVVVAVMSGVAYYYYSMYRGAQAEIRGLQADAGVVNLSKSYLWNLILGFEAERDANYYTAVDIEKKLKLLIDAHREAIAKLNTEIASLKKGN